MRSLLKIVPSGTVVCSAATQIPSNWLECDGGSYSTTDYIDLFDAIGFTFGGSTSSGKFNVPDLSNRFVRGTSSSRSLGKTEQDAFGKHKHNGTTSGGGKHSHTFKDGNGNDTNDVNTNNAGKHKHSLRPGRMGDSDYSPWVQFLRDSLEAWSGYDPSQKQNDSWFTKEAGEHSHSITLPSISEHSNHTHDFTTNETGGNETRPINIALKYIIKT